MAGGAAGPDIQRDRVPPSTVGAPGSMDRWTARQLAADNFVALLMRDENKVFLFLLGHLPQWAGVEIGEISLGLCGFLRCV